MSSEEGKPMKKALYLILENGTAALDVFESIRDAGYNGTLMHTTSLRHAMDENQPEDTHFFSLAAYERLHSHGEAMFAIFVVDESKLEDLKATVRTHTGNFMEIRGGMYSRSIEDYEGSF
jgi:hypothetical protein